MHELLTALPALAAASAGAVVASCGTPACHWSSLGAIALKTRLGMLRQIAPGKRRARLAALGLVALMGAGSLAAYAAQPSAPERLPSEVAGVTGSGDAVTLLLNAGPNPRNLKVGDVYEDGWVVQSISPSEASLAKGGEIRRIGLNPTGAVATAARLESPSKVTVAGQPTEDEIIQRMLASGYWDGKPMSGLTLAETRRLLVYQSRTNAALAAKQAAAMKATGKTLAELQGDDASLPLVGIGGDEMLQAIGAADADDYVALSQKGMAAMLRQIDASGNVNQIRVLNRQEPIGPDTFRATDASYTAMTDAAKAAGLTSIVGYTMGKVDASGGRTLYRTQALYEAAEK